MNSFKFNITDWVLSTNHLTLEEEMVYFRLMTHYYQTEQPLGSNIHELARRLRLSDRKEVVQGILEEFFYETKTGYVSVRCEREIEDLKTESVKRLEKGGSDAPLHQCIH